MTCPSTQDALEAYLSTSMGCTYLASPEFEWRCIDLFTRFDAGETMTVAAASEFLDLPIDVFRHLYAEYLAAQSQAMGQPRGSA
jgi:hypothetical protein